MNKAEHWVKTIDKWIESHNVDYGLDALQGIKATIEETGHVTDKQIQAIKNIRWGKLE